MFTKTMLWLQITERGADKIMIAIPPYHANPGKRVFNSMQKKLWIILQKILQQHYVFQSTTEYLIEAYTHSFIRFGPVCHLYYCNIYFACCSQFFV